jgi:hypothetical protein
VGDEPEVLGRQTRPQALNQERASQRASAPPNRARKRALLVAYHYPPIGTSSGLQRTLSFSRYLGDYGWQPLVLTVHPRAYETVRADQMRDVPEDVVVKRAFALDARRHLSVGRYYPGWLAIPDRWSSWVIGGTLMGLAMVRRYRPDVIWSTFPIATAHIIGLVLHRLTGLPWVADFRDPTTEPGYANRPAHLWLEKQIVRHAARMTFTTPSTLRMYAERYPAEPASRWLELPNGYDEEMFRSAETEPASRPATRAVTLVHSGVLYQTERDPRAFFAAIAKLKRAGTVTAATLQVVLRATQYDSLYAPLLAAEGIDDIVHLAASIPYRAALREMIDADGLLIFQAANCNIQIPAKLYECLRAGRPIFALTDSAGDTAGVLRSTGAGTIAPIDDAGIIAQRLAQFITEVRSGSARTATERVVGSYSRRSLTAHLAECFDAVTLTPARPARAS